MAEKKPFVVNIHGKEYLTVAGRVKLAHEKEEKLGIDSEILRDDDKVVVVKAAVITSKGTFTGISAADKTKPTIEGNSPYEVAQTSAIGRALGFAGYGVMESGIPTYEEMKKAGANLVGTTIASEIKGEKGDRLLCQSCAKEISEKVAEFSESRYGRSLCLNCQKVEVK
jgi:hypothetical protein